MNKSVFADRRKSMKEYNKVYGHGRFRFQVVIDPPRFSIGGDIEYDKEYGALAITVEIGPLWLAAWYNITKEIVVR